MGGVWVWECIPSHTLPTTHTTHAHTTPHTTHTTHVDQGCVGREGVGRQAPRRVCMCGGAAGHPHVLAAHRHTHPAAATPSQRRMVDLLWRRSHMANINEKNCTSASSPTGTFIMFMQECNWWQYHYLRGTYINRSSHLRVRLARLTLPYIDGWGLGVGVCVGSIRIVVRTDISI